MKINLGKVFDTGGGGREPIVEALSVTANGTYTPNEGVDGFNEVNVNVPIPTFTTEELSATANGEYTPTTDGYSKVSVQVPIPTFTTEELSVTANGEYTPSSDGYSKVSVQVPIPTFTTEQLSVTANGEYVPTTDGYSKVTVAVPTPEPNLQSKNIEIVENGTQIISADEGYDGLHNVEVRTNVPLTPQDVIVWQDGMGFNGGRYANENNAADFLFKVDFSNVTKPYGLFQNIYFVSAESFNDILRKIPFEIKGDVRYMFYRAFIASIDRDLHFDLFDLSKIEDASYMFMNFNGNVKVDTNMNLYFDGMRMKGSQIFKGCMANEIHITNPIVILFNNAFESAYIATKLFMPNIESAQITGLDYLFSNATIAEMDISNWKLPNLVNISHFAYNANLSELTFEGWETGIITNAEEAFYYSKLKKLDLTNLKLNLDDSSIRKLFQNCSLLTDLNLSNYDMTALSPRSNSASYYPFYKCNALTNIVTNENTKFPDINWSASNFNNCPNLTAESMVNLFNALPTSTKGYTFTVGETNLAKLTDDQKAIATSKGWTLS